jgi:hypothetical protein
MTCAQIMALLSAILGIAGTVALFFNSWTMQPFAGAVYGGAAVNAANEHIAARNRSRQRWQRIGLALLVASFTVQAITVFVP